MSSHVTKSHGTWPQITPPRGVIRGHLAQLTLPPLPSPLSSLPPFLPSPSPPSAPPSPWPLLSTPHLWAPRCHPPVNHLCPGHAPPLLSAPGPAPQPGRDHPRVAAPGPLPGPCFGPRWPPDRDAFSLPHGPGSRPHQCVGGPSRWVSSGSCPMTCGRGAAGLSPRGTLHPWGCLLGPQHNHPTFWAPLSPGQGGWGSVPTRMATLGAAPALLQGEEVGGAGPARRTARRRQLTGRLCDRRFLEAAAKPIDGFSPTRRAAA